MAVSESDVRSAGADQASLDEMERIDAYHQWQRSEGVQVVGGFYIPDLNTMDLEPWPRKGGRGAIVNLEGTGGVNDAHVVELAPGATSEPERHLYEEMVYILSGRGSTSVWYDEAHKQTFEWGAGSLFAVPINARYQLFNGSGTQPARYVSVTNAPTVINLFHNTGFVFDNPYAFTDRFSGESGYFNGEGRMYKKRRWETNFVPDVRTTKLTTWKERGGGGRNVMIELAQNSMGAHISEFQVGTYKKAHRHGPGAHVIIVGGVGFSLLWPEGQEMMKCDWQPGSVVVPPENWFHEHFNTGREPARYLALRFTGLKYQQAQSWAQRSDQADVSVKEGGLQIEYEDEDPAIHKVFEEELARHGAQCQMKGYVPGCTSSVRAEFLNGDGN